MRNKRILCLFIFVFMIVLSIGAVSAQDADDAIASSDDNVVLEDSGTVSGTASGDVDVVTENPWTTSGELSYDIPSNAKTIKSADVYVNVYSGSAANTYGANANVTIKTDNGDAKYDESLWIVEGSKDGTVYTVNNHTTKCYSDYMIHYDITNLLDGLNGTGLKVKVDTFKMDGKEFDGRIKLIGLVFAYDDGDIDSINYWISSNQLWSDSNVEVSFDTAGVTNINTASLTNIVLSSEDGVYKLNNQLLGDSDSHISGSYYQYNKWDNVTGFIIDDQKTVLNVANAGGMSIKNVLSVLKISNFVADVTLTPEYTSNIPCAYAGTNNLLTIKVNTNNAGKYLVKLLADGVVVNQTEIDLNEGDNTVSLIDPTIRPVDESTVLGAVNNNVTYSVELLFNNKTVTTNSISLPVLYNGNLGKDLAYPAGGFDDVSKITINGDIVIDVKDASSYLGGTAMNRTDVWTLNLGDDSNIVKSFVYVGYNWFNPTKGIAEDINMFNATFNGVKVTPTAFYRDQGNLGKYGAYGYGVLIYDVTSLVNKSGDNSFNLNKLAETPAVYPSAFIYMYNTTALTNTVKEVYIADGADLLAYSTSNLANRPAYADSSFDVDLKLTNNATLYVFAAGAQNNEGNIVFNGEAYENVWSGTSSTTDLYTLDVTGKIKDSNSISFVSTGSTILALQQIIVLNKDIDAVVASLTPEYTSIPSAYAGTNNTITVKIQAIKNGTFTVKLLADGVEVAETETNLVIGDNTVLLTDLTVRPVDETTVNGADNRNVTYVAQIVVDDYVISTGEVVLPVLYNGNLGKDLAYPAGGFDDVSKITINGDIVIDVKDDGTYLGASDMSREDVWTINLGDDSNIVKSFVYVAYNWCNPSLVSEGIDMINATFNGIKVTPTAFYRDQGNLGNYGAYGYGVLIYDVADLINKSGDNKLILNKTAKTPAVYPSALIYMYNTTVSDIIKEVYITNGADLLASSSNLANRLVHTDSTIDVYSKLTNNATLYVFAAGAQAGEGNIVFNGEAYENVWSGTSKTTDLYTLDITGKIKDSNSISFVSTGSTILALQQMIVITKNLDDAEITLAPEYTSNIPCAYAGTNNTITVTIELIKDGNYTVKLLADGDKVAVIETLLNVGSNKVLLTDPTIRPVDESTVMGADNKKVNYTVQLMSGDKILSTGEVVLPVLYNGNLGKDLAYPAGGYESFINVSINGDIVIDVKDVSSYLAAGNMSREDVWTINLDSNSNIVKSYIYVAYNWCNPSLVSEGIDMINATFNDVKVTPTAFYRDQGNLGKYAGYGYGVLVYDVTDLINKAGDNKLVLNKTAKTPAVYPSALIYMYNTTVSNVIKEVYIVNGADLLAYSTANVANRPAYSDSTIDVTVADTADLYIFAASAQTGEGNIVFNGNVYENVWSGTSSTTDLYALDITDTVKESNNISFVSTGSTILALQQIIVTTKNIDAVVASIAPEYTSNIPSAYAGTNNVITVKIQSIKNGNYTVKLLADGVEVAGINATLAVGNNQLSLIDPTIIPVDESTVFGADNKKVNYTVQIVSNDEVISTGEVVLPVLYNGNLGKDFAYPAGGYESFINVTINGDIVIDVKDVSSYLAAGDMNRTDVWTINLDSNSNIVKSYIYVAYNWCNPSLVSEGIDMINATFNDVKVTPIKMYRDQGNLGKYAGYGYGVLVYDVTDLINKAGDNKLVLNKTAKTPAVYPSALIYMYNTTGSAVIRNVFIANGADLLSYSTANLANRAAYADSTIDVTVADTAKLYIFAASAQTGEGNIVFNGNVYENVWNGTSSTTDLFTLDITGTVKNSNNISFVSTGSTILSLQQIIVTTQKAQTKITAPSVTTVYNTNKNLVVTLKDSNGNAISNAKVTVVFNGKTKELTTNAKGQATLAISGTLVPKTYQATISYAGDDTHVKSAATAKVIVKKAKVKLTAKKKTFKAKVKTKKYTITLKNNKGKAIKKAKVTLKIKKKTYKATTNAKGKATFKIKKLTKKGKYTAKVAYKGNKYYNKVTKNVKITVKK